MLYQRVYVSSVTNDYYIQTSELDNTRESLKKYEDYEEIKRELEIMKV
jgi:hypothetical protein